MNIVKELDKFQSIPEAFFRAAQVYPKGIVHEQAYLVDNAEKALKPAECQRRWVKSDFQTVAERVQKIAAYLHEIGLKKGDKVAIISNSRAEWLEADLAVLANGGIVVSVYQSLLAEDIGYILFDSHARFAFVENQGQLDKLRELASSDCPIPATEEREAQTARIELENIITFESTDGGAGVVSWEEILSKQKAELTEGFKELNRDDLACLVYTSGTTGPPKGVIQSHGNHLSNVRQAYQAGIYQDDSEIVLVLPLAHSFAKLMGYIAFTTPAVIKFAAVTSKHSSKLDADSLTRDIYESNSTLVPLVPRMLEKMKDGVERRASSAGLLPSMLHVMIKASLQRFLLARQQKPVPFLTTFQYLLTGFLRRIIKKKIFGNRFRYAVSGGAKLSPIVCEFFNALGIEILEGYGLTETCVATNVNRSGQNKIGTVGPVLADDIELKIAEDGEILYRGPNISRGYYKREAATRAAWDSEGFFHTGDIGEVDNDGYLSITGRKKELIVTAGGKKIAPDVIEQKIKALRFVSQAVMAGEGKPYCVALLTLDPLQVKQNNLSMQEYHEIVWREIELLNKHLASFESIKKIKILEGDFTVENGFLTPTFKVKRAAVIKKYSALVEEMY